MNTPAVPIQGKELYHHLDLVPYIRIPGNFDHESCLKEALRLLPEFTPFQDDTLTVRQSNQAQWKCLALRTIDGDPSKTLTNQYYGAHPSKFKMTEVAALCPKTIEFLEQITDLDLCERIRFLLLEPGARLHTHSDVESVNVYARATVALNMPAGCRFVMDCNPDGTRNPYTLDLPIQAGDLMILNVAKYHFVENNSSKPRIHIMINGPLRFTPEELLAIARKQNQLSSKKEVIAALAQKYRQMGQRCLPQSILFREGFREGNRLMPLPGER